PPAAINIVGVRPHFERELVRHNIFTEPSALPMFPLKEYGNTHPGMELSYVQDGKPGAEYRNGAALAWLAKQREFGRTAAPWIDATDQKQTDIVHALMCAYISGGRFANLVEVGSSKIIDAAIKQFAANIDKFPGDSFPIFKGIALGTVPSAPRWAREYAASPRALGINRIEITPVGSAPDSLYTVTVRSLDVANPDYITVTSMGEKTARGSLVFYLPTVFEQVPGKRYNFSVATADGSSFSLERAEDTYAAVDYGLDLILERARSLAIEDRRDAEEILAYLKSYHQRAPQSTFAREALLNANEYLTAGHALEAYVAAVKAEQLSLPASFQLPPGGGRLVPYWINATTAEGPVKITIKSYDADAAEVSIVSATKQTVKLRWDAIETTAECNPGVSVDVSLVRRHARGNAPVTRKVIKRRVMRRRIPVTVIGPKPPVVIGPKPPIVIGPKPPR
ncbi:MAG: hypothetical protein ABJA67_04825, partial [Chthonomonadales bacterium]